MKKWSIAVFVALFAMACTETNKEQTISGTIENAEGLDVSVIGFTSKGQPDTLATTTLPASGEFSLPIKTGRLGFFVFEVGEYSNIVLAFDSTQSPVVNADYNTMLETYEIKNSKDSKDIRDTYVGSYPYLFKMDSLMQGMQRAAQNPGNVDRAEMANEYNKVRKEYRDYLLSRIEDDSTSLGNFSVVQQLDPEQDLSYFIKVRNGLSPRMSGNVFFDNLANKIAQAENSIRPGSKAPDIVLPTPEGNEVALSSLQGNYVLIDFWAAWCKPCRVENPNLVRIYEKYKNDNFEIFGVSLDQTKDKWVAAIAEDKLPWPQVSDLKYWQSAAAQLYGVQAIPHTVLLDPEGVVIAIKLRGAQLEDKLSSIFGH